MVISKVSKCITLVGVCFFVFVSGCAQKIALKLAPGQQNSYKITTYARRDINWQGPVPKKEAFEESFTEEKVELGFTQRIQSVDSAGKAVARVTIDSLKYLSVVKNQTNVDFDSSKMSDADNPLAKLIGQSYTIVFGPDNYISSVLDLSRAQSLVKGRTSADRAGQILLSPEAVKERQMAILLPQQGEEQLKPGDKWSRIKTYSFGMMGVKSYEKIYTLKEIRDADGRQIAIVDMNAIPTSEVEQGFDGQQAGKDFPRMFDTNDTYTGAGVVDLSAGCIDSYRENLRASWITAFPPDAKSDPNEPVVLRMTATRNYSLEKIK
ncbi:MAG: hypothetical protein ABII09_02770 [Planctomycetota bacterium]